MFDKYIATTTYSVTVELKTLEKYLDSNFLELLLKELHIKSLTESHLSVDYVNDGITFSAIRGIE